MEMEEEDRVEEKGIQMEKEMEKEMERHLKK